MEYIAEKLNFTKQSITKMKANSKEFYIKIKKRRSIRHFKNESVDINIINNAIRSAGTAPNGANLQPWHFVIIKNDKIKKAIRVAAEKEEKIFYNYRAPEEWLTALEPLGTDINKKFLEDAPFLIAVFEKKYSLQKKKENQKLLCKRVSRYCYRDFNILFTFFRFVYVNPYSKPYEFFKQNIKETI